MRPPTKKSMDRAKNLLGLGLLPPGQRGERNLLLRDGWESRLERAGVHPKTLEIVDQEKWDIKLMRFDHDEREKRERKEQAKRHEQKAIKQAIHQLPQQKKKAGPGLLGAEQEEEDPASLMAYLKGQHKKSDIISMNGY
jgi:hypothetical protein